MGVIHKGVCGFESWPEHSRPHGLNGYIEFLIDPATQNKETQKPIIITTRYGHQDLGQICKHKKSICILPHNRIEQEVRASGHARPGSRLDLFGGSKG